MAEILDELLVAVAVAGSKVEIAVGDGKREGGRVESPVRIRAVER